MHLPQKSESEVDVVLEKAITIFRFLSNKDLFETYYRRHLARRLLQQRSLSDDAERGLLAKLKVESGASFVRDAEGMIKDMKLSSEATTAYKEHLRKTENVGRCRGVTLNLSASSFIPSTSPCRSVHHPTGPFLRVPRLARRSLPSSRRPSSRA
jgi:cullin 3